MSSNNPIHITQEDLNTLETKSNIQELITEPDFQEALKPDKAILYILVNWSVQERFSRYVVYKALSQINNIEIPLYKMDCSYPETQFVADWVSQQPTASQGLVLAGYGEILLLERGKIIDFVTYPAKVGIEKMTAKLIEWTAAHK